ncbi:MAG: GNAT family N-acetyltransferase [Candidatus Sericytochromatia bacterium]
MSELIKGLWKSPPRSARLLLLPPHPELAPRVSTYFYSQRAYLTPWNPSMRPVFFSEAHQREKLRQERKQMHAHDLLKFWLVSQTAPESAFIGHVAFSNLVFGAFQSCFLGYSIAAEHRGRGYAAEAIAAGLELVFGTLQMHRVEANIMPRNTASVRVVQKLGFVCEGLSPKYLKINGVWEDHAHWVLRNHALE